MNQACRDLLPDLGVLRVYAHSTVPRLQLAFRDYPLDPP